MDDEGNKQGPANIMATHKGEKLPITPIGLLISVSTALSTRERAITLESVASSLETLQQTAGVMTIFYMPMLLPATYASLIFEEPNVMEFLERYEDLYTDYRVSNEDKFACLP